MRDVDFFSRLLRLEHPWRVEHVALDPKERQIDVWLVHRRNAFFTCSECGIRSPLYDHIPSRSWRHLDHDDCPTCQLLVHMSTTVVVPPVSIPAPLPVAPAPPVVNWRAPVVSLHCFALIRGPPILLEICA